jgi:hypothetical protein
MEAGSLVSDGPSIDRNPRPKSKVSRVERSYSMIPMMGICYMLQYMDKLALSQATLMNIRGDLVSDIINSVPARS